MNNEEEGGEAAADELLVKTREHMRSFMKDCDKIDVVARAYANLKGFGKACVRTGRMKNSSDDLHSFANGFTQRQALFDFVDVGTGKEQADDKIRGEWIPNRAFAITQGFHELTFVTSLSLETFKLFIGNWQCKHIVLGCCQDTDFGPFLAQFAADDPIHERITLLQGGSMERRIAKLGFKRTLRLDTLFGCSNEADSVAAPLPNIPSTKSSSGDPIIDSERLGPVLRNEQGQRIDRKLDVAETLVSALRNARLCQRLYLRGRCTGCPHVHTFPPLNAKSYDALWFIARQNLCHKIRKGEDCNDAKCFYGHRDA